MKEFAPPTIVLLDADSSGAILMSGLAVFFALRDKAFGHFKQIEPFRVDRGELNQNGRSLCWREKSHGLKNGWAKRKPVVLLVLHKNDSNQHISMTLHRLEGSLA